MTLAPNLRKLTLTMHVTVSVGWLGALAVFLAHAVVSVFSNDAQLVRAADVAMGVTAWFVILPLSIAAVTSGLVQALGTAWGLFRHYWVLAKLLLTVLATVVLLLKLAPISHLTDMAAQTGSVATDRNGLRMSLLVHAVGGLFVLLTTTTLALYKPRGITPYGIRKQRELADVSAPPGTPTWVKVFAAMAAVLVLMTALMMLGGEHGPGAHLPR